MSDPVTIRPGQTWRRGVLSRQIISILIPDDDDISDFNPPDNTIIYLSSEDNKNHHCSQNTFINWIQPTGRRRNTVSRAMLGE